MQTDQHISVYTSAVELSKYIQELKQRNISIGFVPTMGALHQGHVSLIELSKKENQFTLCSIFVNPTQFNNLHDLQSYPRMENDDVQKLQHAGCDLAFIPSVNEIYPNGFNLLDIDLGEMEHVMEGAYRPGHFNGMLTVVHRLLSIAQPDVAYFGNKDFQQQALVKAMVNKMHLTLKITGVETVREADGLAMSSRNLLLSKEQRKAAPLIYKALQHVQEMIPHQEPAAIKTLVKRFIEQSPYLRLQYFELVDQETLEPLNNYNGRQKAQACIAVLTDGPRLIDNIEVKW